MNQPATANAKHCDKKIKSAESRVQKILNKIDTLKIKEEYLLQLHLPKNVTKTQSKRPKLYCAVTVIILLLGILVKWCYELRTKSCLMEMPSSTKTLFRPPEDCSMCTGVEGVARVANVSGHEFEEQYAYSAAPVIVTDATYHWKAIKEFDFKFFADFYRNAKMGQQINDCSFFAYKSGLHSLEEVFDMEESRANLTGAPWYVGWSTCYSEETRRLRAFYQRPYFLPATAESDMVDWLFMGGPGQGAHMHVDSVKHMSWQAQIRGRKQWLLAPPPECLYACRWLSFTVEPGEILVVNTNRWYHKTNVLPGDISITIGAEYD